MMKMSGILVCTHINGSFDVQPKIVRLTWRIGGGYDECVPWGCDLIVYHKSVLP